MKATYFKNLLVVAGAALLCATTLISSQSITSAETKKPTKGQDVGDENCERIDTAESSTFGKCKSVCKDKDVSWDAVGRRYVCNATKAAVRRPFGQVGPIGDKVLDTRPPKKLPPVAPKLGKARKH